jgi:protein-S-isoprenylcysteine O-methyltransferase Ste14
MEPIILKIAYTATIIITYIIRYPHAKRNKSNQIRTDNKDTSEKYSLRLVQLGSGAIPFVYVFSDLLSFANYSIPVSLQILGLILIAPTLWLIYKSHKDLGMNWSASLEIREEHNIIDTGIYKHIRHPMYSAGWLWGIAQALLLHNFMAGLSGIVCFGVLYFLRVNKEEEMMIQEFGQEYENYMKRTKRIIPYIF